MFMIFQYFIFSLTNTAETERPKHLSIFNVTILFQAIFSFLITFCYCDLVSFFLYLCIFFSAQVLQEYSGFVRSITLFLGKIHKGNL